MHWVWDVARKGVVGDRATEVRRREVGDRGPSALASTVSETLRKFVRAQHESLRCVDGGCGGVLDVYLCSL